jgi:hypothetical protein
MDDYPATAEIVADLIQRDVDLQALKSELCELLITGPLIAFSFCNCLGRILSRTPASVVSISSAARS